MASRLNPYLSFKDNTPDGMEWEAGFVHGVGCIVDIAGEAAGAAS